LEQQNSSLYHRQKPKFRIIKKKDKIDSNGNQYPDDYVEHHYDDHDGDDSTNSNQNDTNSTNKTNLTPKKLYELEKVGFVWAKRKGDVM
jgi:hypothetical protein